MVNAIVNYLGEYVQLTGDGIASINWPWILSACLFLMCIWFVFKIVLKFFDWVLK